jgi:Putative 2OG-Fe(II) oxygenase
MIKKLFKDKPTIYKNIVSVQQFKNMQAFGPGTEFSKKVDKYFNHPFLEERKNRPRPPEQEGDAITTVGMDRFLPFFKTTGLEGTELGDWLSKSFYKGAKDLDLPVDPKKHSYKLHKAWANRIYENTSGKAHAHGAGCHITAIFYYEVPENSSDLLFLNEPLYDRISVNNLNYENVEVISPKPGMLVMHDPWIPHAVSKHNSKLPRTCFVFDIVFPDLPINRPPKINGVMRNSDYRAS